MLMLRSELMPESESGIQTFQQTLVGLAVVRAYNIGANHRRAYLLGLDLITQSTLMSNSTQRWIGVRVDGLTALWCVAIALFIVFLKSSLGPSICGLALSQCTLLSGMLQFAVRMMARRTA